MADTAQSRPPEGPAELGHFEVVQILHRLPYPKSFRGWRPEFRCAPFLLRQRVDEAGFRLAAIGWRPSRRP